MMVQVFSIFTFEKSLLLVAWCGVIGDRLEHSQVAAGEGKADGCQDLELPFVFNIEHKLAVAVFRPDHQVDDVHAVHVVRVVLPIEVHVDLDAGDLQVGAEVLKDDESCFKCILCIS